MIRCDNCQHDNPEQMRFCGECGSPLPRKCRNCGFSNPATFKFCGNCGGSLRESGETSLHEPALQERTAPEGERRQLTVMFCDIVGSTALSEQLDPEDFREVLTSYQERCSDVITGYDGYIAQYLGDGILVYFGFPQAHEDDARRGVRAGLEIHEAIASLNNTLMQRYGIEVALRIGIHTGLVVVGQIGGVDRREQLALGETLNVASRVQSIADPGSVVITSATRHLVRGYFEGSHLGQFTLRGISQPLDLFQVTRSSRVQDRLNASSQTERPPLVGREQERTSMRAAWELTLKGSGQVMELCGEAGIGKSRMVEIMTGVVAHEAHLLLDCRCSPYYQNTPLYPLVELLERITTFERDDTPLQRIEKLSRLERILWRYDITASDNLPLLADLLAVPMEPRAYNTETSPKRQKQKMIEALLSMAYALGSRRPLLIVVEDLHWADPSTLELLSHLVAGIGAQQIFLLFTYRSGFVPPWPDASNISRLTLNRLEPEEVRTIINRLTDGKHLPPEIVQQIVEKTDGVPLFVEELTKMVLESGMLRETDDRFELDGPLPPLAIPATLHDSLMARLDRLSTLKEVAQLGASIGRAFDFELIREVSPLDERLLRQALDRLVESGLLFESGSTYTFKHALIQDAAYESLLRTRRGEYHQKIASVLENRFPERAIQHPELLAHHYTGAGLLGNAVTYWQRAGERALCRSAYLEAIAHLRRGLEQAASLPVSNERELGLTIPLGVALMATRGYAAEEVTTTYSRAYDLCQTIEGTPLLRQALIGLAISSFLRGELQAAYGYGSQMLELAEGGNERFRLGGHMLIGATNTYLGDLDGAIHHLDRGIALYDRSCQPEYATHYGQDPLVVCMSYRATVLMVQGHLDQGYTQSLQSLAYARELGHPLTLAFALNFTTGALLGRGEAEKAYQLNNELIAIATEQNLQFWLSWGMIHKGWIRMSMGSADEAQELMEQGFRNFKQTGARLGGVQIRATLARFHVSTGQYERGLELIEEAMVTVRNDEQDFQMGDLYATHALLLTEKPEPDMEGAEALLRRSIDLAKKHGARFWQLSNSFQLAGLLHGEGRSQEAYSTLAPVHGWFTEGLELPLYRQASGLLEELQRNAFESDPKPVVP